MPPPRKTECILLFDPATQSFTLEKLSSTFTFNANVYALAHPPLPLRPPIPDGEDDDASAGEKEDDNPFDYRHFINKKSTTKTRAEQKAEREERRKEALKRAGKGAPEDDEPEEEDEDELPGLGITYDRPKIGGKGFSVIGPPKKVGGKSPPGGKKPVAMSPGVPLPSPAHVHRAGDSSDEDESDEADDEDEMSDDETAAPPPPPPPPPPRPTPVARKPPVPRNTTRRKVQQEEPEEIVFPEPSQPLHTEDHSEEDISDSESDEDAPPPLHPNSASVPVQEEEEEEEDDGFDLAELLEKELENGGDLDMDAEGEVYEEGEADGDVDAEADGVIIFEDDEVAPPRGPPKAVGLGIGAAGVPISFGQMMGGGVEDESESESEEE